MAIRCITKDLTLCDYHVQHKLTRKIDLIGVFTAFWTDDLFPRQLPEFCVYAELVNGEGKQRFTARISLKGTDEVIAEYPTGEIYFPDPYVIKPLAIYIGDLLIRESGVYLVKLFQGDHELGEAEFLAGQGD